MNNIKLKKYLVIILIIFTTFFSLNISAKAKTTVEGYLPYPSFTGKHSCPNTNFCYSLCKYNSNGTCNSNKETSRMLRQVGIYFVYDGKNYQHAYCIEPGISAAFPGSGYGSSFDAEKITKESEVANISELKKVLSYAYKLQESDRTYLNSKFKSVSVWNTCITNKTCEFKDNYYKSFAAQGIIWEVLEGQRTSFSNCTISNCAPNHNNAIDGVQSFYTMIKKLYDNNTNKTIYESYVKLIQDVYNAYYKPLKDSAGYEFLTESSAKTYKLKWDSKQNKFALTIGYGKTALDYWELDKDKTSQDLNVSISDAITITTTKSIDTPAMVGIKLNSAKMNSGTAFAFKESGSTNLQDVITVGGVSRSLAIKVYTPKYQLKVKKVNESNNALQGVSFYVCKNKISCNSTNKIATITTNISGEATYKNLEKPGTYYIKEVEAPEGYVEDNNIYSVNVTESNEVQTTGAGSFATVTIKNKLKEFTLTKTVWSEEEGERLLTCEEEGTCEEETSETYIGPEFQIKNSNKLMTFRGENGIYYYDSSSSLTNLRTNNGTFKVYGLPDCKYTIEEVKAPDGQTLPSSRKREVNVCTTSEVEFVNGFTGLEFHKKNENGELLSGGEYTLQVKENNYYKDVLLKEEKQGLYTYSSSLEEDDEDATYVFETGDEYTDIKTGKAFIKNLPPGEYRVIEKIAPDGYDLIEDKDSTSIVKITEANKNDNYIVEMVDRKSSTSGGEASAELVLTITTGRMVINYLLIISGLVVLLILAYIIRKKFKK